MRPVRYSQQADRDILDIWLHVASASSVTLADRVLDLIKLRCSRLDEFPHMGPARPEIFSSARTLVIDRWLAIYQVEKAGPKIIRVIDSSRNLSGLTFPQN